MSECQNVFFFFFFFIMQNSIKKQKSELNNGLRTEQIVVMWLRLRQQSCVRVIFCWLMETARLPHHKHACQRFSEKVWHKEQNMHFILFIFSFLISHHKLVRNKYWIIHSKNWLILLSIFVLFLVKIFLNQDTFILAKWRKIFSLVSRKKLN